MEVVVQGERPKAMDRRHLPLGESDLIRVAAAELLTLAVVVRVDVLRFFRAIVVHVRLGGSGAVEIVGSPLRIVHRRVPAITSGTAVVTPLKEGIDQFA